MNTKLAYDHMDVRKPAGLMLLFCAIPVFIVVSYIDFGSQNIFMAQLCFAYMWLWFLGVILYWHHRKVLTTPWHYALAVTGLIFNGVFVIFIPYIFR